MRHAMLFGMAVLAITGSLAAGTVHVEVGVIVRDSNMHLLSAGYASYTSIFGYETNESLGIVHAITNTDAYASLTIPAPYNRSIESSAPATPPNCYQGYISAVADDSTGASNSPQICFQGPPPPPPGGGGNLEDCYSNDETCPGGSPIVVNLNGDDYQLTGLSDPVVFDISASGRPRVMGWTAAGVSEAFLALDRNGNGRIDSGAELFGNHTPLANGHIASNGFEALRELDSNGDGVIDSADAAWSRLLLWTDRNHNGISEPDEIVPISLSPVRAIDLRYHWTGRRDQFGNSFRFESQVLIWNGHAVIPRPVYDIYFVLAQ